MNNPELLEEVRYHRQKEEEYENLIKELKHDIKEMKDELGEIKEWKAQLLWEMALFSKKALHNIEKH